MISKDNQLVVLGETNFRNNRWRFGIKQDDRRRHMYVVGSTGMGKTEFLKNMAIQDIEAGRGIGFIDPHGDSADDLLDHIPAERIKDVIYLDPGDLAHPVAFNVMEKVDFEFRHLVASGLLGVFKKIFGVEVWSGRMEYILNNTILALLEYPDATLLGINKMLSNKEYRKKVVDNVKDPIVRSFWVDEFAKYTERFAAEATPAIQNKIGQFISNNLIRNIIGQTHSTVDVRKIMDEGKIFIVNISRGKIGEDASRLLGALLVTKIQLAAMSRVDIPEKDRLDFYLYVDEFQHFATESFANILSEARKYHLSLIMAHQYIKQMEEPVMDAVFGNVGTIISFRVGAEDGEYLEKWFQPDFLMNDIVNLGKYNIYLKLMIDGVSSKGFSAQTIPPLPSLEKSSREAILEYSRKTYATSREVVEKSIAEWAGTSFAPEKPPARPYAQASPDRFYESSARRDDRPYDRTPRQEISRQEIPRTRQAFPPTSEQSRPAYRAPEQAPRIEPRPVIRPQEPISPPVPTSPPNMPKKARTIGLEPRPAQTRPQPAPQNQHHQPVQAQRSTEVFRPQPFDHAPAKARLAPEERQGRPFDHAQGRPQDQIQPPVHTPQSPPAREPVQTPTEFRAQQQSQQQLRPSGLSFDDAIRQGPVNFRGKRMAEERKEKPKAEVNTGELRKALEEAMKTSGE
ncbi:MAG: type IV secretion system DNA-binding domain-containing protein [Candidatus Taylorbacteria bacterium]|nr:type IV secretion system DNA-binding domain-containing protein [Candidatus Taylorbacteria bacterium]